MADNLRCRKVVLVLHNLGHIIERQIQIEIQVLNRPFPRLPVFLGLRPKGARRFGLTMMAKVNILRGPRERDWERLSVCLGEGTLWKAGQNGRIRLAPQAKDFR
jgi:hypothetical protein